MKNRKIKSAIIVLLLLNIICIPGCGKDTGKEEIRYVINNFEKACQEINISEALECVNPTIANPLKAGITLANLLTENSAIEQFTKLLDKMMNGIKLESSNVLRSIEIRERQIKVSGKGASYIGYISFQVNDFTTEQKIDVNMCKKNDRWYIEKVKLIKDK